MQIAKRCWVSGRVQGVFFRASTQQKARELGLSGYAKNLADGRVEVLMFGDRDRIDELERWLWQGPPTAHVTSVETMDVLLEDLGSKPAGFGTR